MAKLGPAASAVVRSLQSASLEDRDKAGAWLARRYAMLIDVHLNTEDEYEVMKDLGPKLLATLTALGMTPAARRGVVRGAVTTDDGPDEPEDELAKLRNLRGADTRNNRTTGLHTATS